MGKTKKASKIILGYGTKKDQRYNNNPYEIKKGRTKKRGGACLRKKSVSKVPKRPHRRCMLLSEREGFTAWLLDEKRERGSEGGGNTKKST